MKVRRGLAVITYEADGNTLGIQVKFPDGIDHRNLIRILAKAFKWKTGRQITKKEIKECLGQLNRV